MRPLASLPPPPRWLSVALLALLAIGAIWVRFYHLGRLSLWQDEVASLVVARLAPGEIWGADTHPPLYYLLLHYWRPLVGDDEGWLRLPSALFSLAALPAVWLIGRRIGGPWLALAATAIAAFHPYELRFAQELRMYALLECAAAWALAGFATLLADPAGAARPIGRGTWLPWALLGLGTLVALYTHNMAMLLPMTTTLLAVALWWRRGERWALARNWALVHGLVLAAWLPFLPELLHQATLSNINWIPEAGLEGIWQVQPLLAYGLYDIDSAWEIVTAIALLLLTVAGWRALPRPSPWPLALPVLALLPAAVTVALSWAFRPVYLARPLIWTGLPVAVLVGAGVVALLSAARPRFAAVGALVVLLAVAGNCYGVWSSFRASTKADARGVAQLVLQWSEPAEVLLVPYAERLAMAYYLDLQSTGTGRAPPRVLGLVSATPVASLWLVGTMPRDRQFLLIEVSWRNKRAWLVPALQMRFPCHAATRLGERSGMVLWRYAEREDCKR